MYLFAGAGGAVGLGLYRLLKRFYRLLGLGVVLNPWTALFLGLIAVSSGVSYLMLAPMMQASAEPGSKGGLKLLGLGHWQPFLTVVGGLLGNASSLVLRLPRRLRTGTDASSQVKDLKGARSENLFTNLIQERIMDGMQVKLHRMAKQYDWGLIKTTVSQLLQDASEMDGADPKDAEETVKFVLAFEPSQDVRADRDNKYAALRRALRVTSFRHLRARLAHSANEEL